MSLETPLRWIYYTYVFVCIRKWAYERVFRKSKANLDLIRLFGLNYINLNIFFLYLCNVLTYLCFCSYLLQKKTNKQRK